MRAPTTDMMRACSPHRVTAPTAATWCSSATATSTSPGPSASGCCSSRSSAASTCGCGTTRRSGSATSGIPGSKPGHRAQPGRAGAGQRRLPGVGLRHGPRAAGAVWARDVLLAPVLVGDCFWSVVPELAAVQWLHDPAHDGPLGLHAGNPAERDRRIHRACDRLLTVALEPALAGAAPALSPPPPVSVPAPTRRPPEPAGPVVRQRPSRRPAPHPGARPRPFRRFDGFLRRAHGRRRRRAVPRRARAAARGTWCATSWTGWSTPSSAPSAGSPSA